VSLQVTSKSLSDLHSRTEGDKVFQIRGAEIRKDLEPKLRLWRGTDSNKVAKSA